MIGYLKGDVLFSDGIETILLTTNGVGHQVYLNKVLVEGSASELYISHIVKEASEELYGFTSLRCKKLFELLIKVKNVGPKSAYSLISALGSEQIINAILLENKASLKKAPGVGERAAAQMILDLSGKIAKIKMYADQNNQIETEISSATNIVEESLTAESLILSEAIMACKELGFVEEKILPVANKLILENKIMKAEQLVHLVLREM
mgnify:CR=1 FL=1|jgi:holliday junction DNA helicase RuvA